MQPDIIKTLLGGFAGTLAMTLTMRFAASMMVGHPIDITVMLGNMMGGVYALGMAVYIVLVMLGVSIFPLAYTFLLFRILPGTPFVKGLLFGSMLWLIAEAMVMPMAGAGFFMSENGGMKAAIAALMGHLAYGGLLGVIAGRADCCCSVNRHLA